MKKRIALGIGLTLTSTLLGQGLIAFQNRNTAVGINAPIYLNFVGDTLLNGTGYRVALLGGPTNAIPAYRAGSRTNGPHLNHEVVVGTLSMLGSPSTGATWTTFRTGTAAGYVGVGTDVARDSGLPYGSIGQFQLVAWSGNYNSWPEAVDAYLGGDGLNNWIGAGNPMFLPTTLSASDQNLPTLQGLESFAIVNFVPEPSSLALFACGLAGWRLRERFLHRNK
jgi:hypothetical protein